MMELGLFAAFAVLFAVCVALDNREYLRRHHDDD